MSVVTETDDRVGACYRMPEPNAVTVPRPSRRARELLEGIDECLNLLEERHLNGSCIGRQRACNRLVEGLILAYQAVPPEAVWSARTSFALHAALLDWQSSILDEVVPHRRELFPDLETDREDWPIPRLRRARRGRGGRQAAKTALAGAA
jgi:hypothetical protein